MITLTVMRNGEHWFHTEEQMKFLDEWINKSRQLEVGRMCDDENRNREGFPPVF